jgi:hypothetical protein
VCFALDHDRSEASCEEMTVPPVSPVELEGVAAGQVFHSRAERRLERLEHEVHVSVHEAVRVELPFEPLAYALESRQEVAAVGVVLDQSAFSDRARDSGSLTRTLRARWPKWPCLEKAKIPDRGQA